MQRNSKLVILGYLGMLCHTRTHTHTHTHTHTPKMIVSIWRNLWKNQLHPSRFSWDIAKVLQSCCFGYFWQGLLHTPKLILSICWKLSCLFVGKVSTSSTTFFGAIAKIWNLILKSYFGYLGHVWIRTPKMMVSTCIKVSPCQKKLYHLLLSCDFTF